MDKNIENYFYRKENFLDEKYCSDCIDELQENDWGKHEWYLPNTDLYDVPQGDHEPEVIGKETFSNNVKEINDFIVEELHSAILGYISNLDFNWFVGWKGYCPIKFIRYHPGQKMQNHCDHISSLFDDGKGIPILSIIGLLNDDYEGGDLIMFEDKKIDTKKGDLLIFPSNFLYPHEITPVTKGVRYSFVSWAW